jgi:hypothetical protein
MGYTYTENPIILFIREQENNEGSMLSTYENFPKFQALNVMLNFNHKITFWQPNYTVGLYKPFFTATYEGKEIAYNQAMCMINVYNDFTLPLSFVLSCNFRYRTKARQYYMESEERKQLDLGVRKSFLNNALRFNLTAYDIFDWAREQGHTQFNNIRWDINKKSETRYVSLSVTYMFNNYKKKYRGESAAKDDINRF